MAIRACLFDMDGLLIDSEAIYTATTEQLLANHGRPPHFPIEVKSSMMGRPGPEAARVFLEWAQLEDLAPEAYMAEQRDLQRTRFPHVQPLPGALALVQGLKARNIGIALATSSTTSNYALKSTNLRHLFDLFDDVRVTGDDARVAGRGKPRPDIFLTALADLNKAQAARHKGDEAYVPIVPDECLVFEDAIPGVEAGLAAGMQVVWIPDAAILALHQDQVDDILQGRGELLSTLEAFDYNRYGMPSM